ncbi:MAG: sigma-70 family RNA polymerase sigma factor, partial [Alloalcanivorax venustensis]
MSDEQLVKKAKSGDQRAFEVLVLKYQQRIFALISRYVRDHDEVQDVAQEAFIKAFSKLNQFKAEVTFGAWLKRIVINKSIDCLKSRKQHLQELEEVHLKV